MASGAVVVPASQDLGLGYLIFSLTLSQTKVRDNACRSAALRDFTHVVGACVGHADRLIGRRGLAVSWLCVT